VPSSEGYEEALSYGTVYYVVYKVVLKSDHGIQTCFKIIQVKATEYFLLVLFIVCRISGQFRFLILCGTKILKCDHSNAGTEQYLVGYCFFHSVAMGWR